MGLSTGANTACDLKFFLQFKKSARQHAASLSATFRVWLARVDAAAQQFALKFKKNFIFANAAPCQVYNQ
jgi:hypothetical protein